MTSKISFLCPSCLARIKAPRELIGKRRNCPGCGNSLVIRERPTEKGEIELHPPQDSGPLLVAEGDTVDMMLDPTEVKSDPTRRLEELEAENARLKRLLAKLAEAVGG